MGSCQHGCGRKAEGTLRRGGQQYAVCERCAKLVTGGVVEVKGGCGRRVLVSPASPLAGVLWALPQQSDGGLVSILRPIAEGIGLQMIAGPRDDDDDEESGRPKRQRAQWDTTSQFDNLPPEILTPIVMNISNGHDLRAVAALSPATREILRDPINAAQKITEEHARYMARLQEMKQAAPFGQYDPMDETDLPALMGEMFFDKQEDASDWLATEENRYALERRQMFATLLAYASSGDTIPDEVRGRRGITTVQVLPFVGKLPRHVQEFVADHLLGRTTGSIAILRSIYAQPWVSEDMTGERKMFRAMFRHQTDQLAPIYFASGRQNMSRAGTEMWVMRDFQRTVADDKLWKWPTPHQEVLEHTLMNKAVTERDVFNLWYFEAMHKKGWKELYGRASATPVWYYPRETPLDLLRRLVASRMARLGGDAMFILETYPRFWDVLDEDAHAVVRDGEAYPELGFLRGYQNRVFTRTAERRAQATRSLEEAIASLQRSREAAIASLQPGYSAASSSAMQ